MSNSANFSGSRKKPEVSGHAQPFRQPHGLSEFLLLGFLSVLPYNTGIQQNFSVRLATLKEAFLCLWTLWQNSPAAIR